MQNICLVLVFSASVCYGRRLQSNQFTGRRKLLESSQQGNLFGSLNPLTFFAKTVVEANATAAFNPASIHILQRHRTSYRPVHAPFMTVDDVETQSTNADTIEIQGEILDRIALEELSSQLDLTPAHSSEPDLTPAHSSELDLTPDYSSELDMTPGHSSELDLTPAHSSELDLTPEYSSELDLTPVHEERKHEESKERVAESLKLLDDVSEEMHPGHCAGRFDGPGPEFDGMEYDSEALQWRLKPGALENFALLSAPEDKDNGASTSTALVTLSDADKELATKFDTEGGLALVLASSFRRPEKMRIEASKVFKAIEESEDGKPTGPLPDLSSLAEDAISYVGLIPGKTLEDWMLDFERMTLEQKAAVVMDLAYVLEEKEALRRTTWSDVEFHAGEDGNEELVNRLEMQFAHQLADTISDYVSANESQFQMNYLTASGRLANETEKDQPQIVEPNTEDEKAVFGMVLHGQAANDAPGTSLMQHVNEDVMNDTLWEAKNLGVAIDLVGAYLKNYDIDKADALITRVMPLCRDRGGPWVIKGLDKLSTVRMKQKRHKEALVMLREMEEVVPFEPEESWEYFDILYRNLAWAYTALDDTKNQLKYTKKSVEIKRKCGIKATWFDIWDLGKTHAKLGQETNERDEMKVGYALCEKAAEIHIKAEPSDTVMLAKIYMSIGEVAMGIGDTYWLEDNEEPASEWYQKAEPSLLKSYELHNSVLGSMKPLTGWSAGNVAHCMVRLARYEEAQKWLALAFKVECSKDATTPGSVRDLVERLMGVHTELDDIAGMRQYADDIDFALVGLRDHGWDRLERYKFGALLHKVATAYLMGDNGTGDMLTKAVTVLREAEASLLLHQGESQGDVQDDTDAILDSIRANLRILSIG